MHRETKAFVRLPTLCCPLRRGGWNWTGAPSKLRPDVIRILCLKVVAAEGKSDNNDSSR